MDIFYNFIILTIIYGILNNRRPFGIDKDFLMQVFVGPDNDIPATDTQKLLSKMFQEQNITFAEVC